MTSLKKLFLASSLKPNVVNRDHQYTTFREFHTKVLDPVCFVYVPVNMFCPIFWHGIKLAMQKITFAVNVNFKLILSN